MGGDRFFDVEPTFDIVHMLSISSFKKFMWQAIIGSYGKLITIIFDIK